MDKPLNYRLPDPLEDRFRDANEKQERRQVLAIHGIASVIISIFILLEFDLLATLPGYHWGMTARFFALGTSLFGFFRLRRGFDHKTDEPFVFLAGLIVILHIVVNNYIQRDAISTAAAWDIAVIFATYSLVPISFHYRLILALTLTFGSQAIWVAALAGQINTLDILTTPVAYLAANYFGIRLSLDLNRTQRHEFQLLVGEQDSRNKLERTKVVLENTLKTKDQLFSIVAHDLRGPLGSLSEIGKVLSSDTPLPDAKRERLLNLLYTGTESSHELLENLLNWSLSETGSLVPKIQELDLNQAITSSLELLEASAANKQITLSYRPEESLDVMADPKMLDTILRNLLANSIKFTREGGNVTITQNRLPSDHARITISDDGVGISPERLHRIFELGFEDTKQGTIGENGTNLGLKICHDFTLQQGGKIDVQSEAQRGTRISLTFPLARD